MTPETLVPMMALIVDPPLPDPELVIVPALLMDDPDNVIPAAVALLLLRTRLPMPLAPPDKVSSLVPLLLVSVVPPEFADSAPLNVSAEVVLFSVKPVTLEPMLALIVVVPVPAPVLVIVPTLLIAAVERVMVPEVALLLMVKLLVPVTPPLKVVEIAVPVLPSVNMPVVVDASNMAFEYVSPVVPINNDALLLPPALLPSVMVPVPSALAAADVAVIVPE